MVRHEFSKTKNEPDSGELGAGEFQIQRPGLRLSYLSDRATLTASHCCRVHLILSIGLGVVLGLIPALPSFAAPPTLTHLFPPGAKRGSKVAVTCHGAFAWPLKTWSPGIEITPLADSGKLEVSVPADLAADRIWVRLYNDEGASVFQPFLIGGLDESSEVEPNDRPREAQAVSESAVTMNGVLKENDVDCFAVKLDAGQTLIAALDANTRLGSPMDAILQIVSPTGVVLAENHDDLKLDPRLAFTATQMGTYVVRLFGFPSAPDASIRFIGGANYVYRLTLTTGPFVTHAAPLSAPLENPGTVKPEGWNLPTDARLNVVRMGDGKLADLQEREVLDELRRSPESQVGFAFSPALAMGTRVRLSPQPVIAAFERIDPKMPLTIPSPSSVTGCLKVRKQADEFRVPLMKGRRVIISAESRSLGLRLDPVLKLASPSGSLIAEVDDTGPTRDALIAHTPSEDGEYRITVVDRFHQASDRWYLLTVRDEQREFQLTLSTDAIIVTPDKPFELPVKIQRSGDGGEPIGPISIQAINLPEGVATATVISEQTGPTATEIKLSFTSTGRAFSGPIQIEGKSTGANAIQRFARTPARLDVSFETIWLTATAKP